MTLKYRVGIDVGTHSCGMTAVEIDENNIPVKILSSVSHIHDSGVDPKGKKDNGKTQTRLASSGFARRTRRLYRNRRRRLIALDKFIAAQGWISKDFEEYQDPFYPWRVREELATRKIDNAEELGEKLSIALRHIARHRGWRNPYSKIQSLYVVTSPSTPFETIRQEFEKALGISIPQTATVGQIIATSRLGKDRLRGENGLICALLQQSDHANEIHKIGEVQGLDKTLIKEVLDAVFAAESPKGSAAGRAGKDPLQPHLNRALKATDAFQRYRIAALIGNLRIRNSGKKFPLDVEQFQLVFDHLYNLPAKKDPEWTKVAEILGIDRGDLFGTATMTDDGERAGARPPVNETNRQMESSKIKPLVAWWKQADADKRAAMVNAMSNGAVDDFDSEAGASVQAFFADLSDKEHTKLDKLHLPIGRAAYSEDTLLKLANRMVDHAEDLYTARRAIFQVPNDWVPPAPAIGEPVGNPAVDRVFKIVARWLEAANQQWGAPLSVNVEHIRAAFVSADQAKRIDNEIQARTRRNLKLIADMNERLGIEGRPRRSDLWRFQSIQRQNGQCAYCGAPIDYFNCEMDHIIPRRGQGSTNTRENLVAVCRRCNSSKSNTPFAVWAEQADRPGVSVAETLERVRRDWLRDPGLNATQFRKFVDEVCQRLTRTSVDEEIDTRSFESIAWMANELRARVKQRFADFGTNVNVYMGALTKEARLASGISGNLKFVDGTGKSRLDRRHHAVDAAIIAFLSPYVAETLAQRQSLKFEQEILRQPLQWKEFTGADTAHKVEWHRWMRLMQALANLLQQALDQDEIVVMSNLRLRLRNSRVHEDKIREFKPEESYVRLGDPISAARVDRASSEALWCALTRLPDYDPKEGLPADNNRRIRVNGIWYGAEDQIKIFPGNAGAIALRGGYARLGESFHHARIFKLVGGKRATYAMMRVYAVDLVKFRSEDLFSVELAPQTMTMRQCDSKLREALANGTAEYLGWLVVDDELLINTSSFTEDMVGRAHKELGTIKRWRVDGFPDSKLRLRPIQLSAEGLAKDAVEAVKNIVEHPGWRVAVNRLFDTGSVVVIRRNALGQPRMESSAHLPTCWVVK